MTWPNGETLTYSYETATLPGDPGGRPFYRPTRIESNLGFFITIDYQGDTLGTNEWNSVEEAAIYASSAPTTPLGRLTYGANGTITDLGGRVYTCSGCTNSLGSGVEVASGSMQLPGESGPASEAVALPGAPGSAVVGSVTIDGVQWSYAYTNLRVDGGSTTLYRAAGPNEVADIPMNGNRYRTVEGGAEGKYFSDTSEQASNYARMQGDKAYTTTSVDVSPAELARGHRINPAGEGQGYFFETTDLPTGPVTIFDHSVLP